MKKSSAKIACAAVIAADRGEPANHLYPDRRSAAADQISQESRLPRRT